MGFLFLILYPGFSSSSLPPPASRLPPPPPHVTTQCFITHPLSHTLFDTQSFTHTNHTIFHTPSLTSSFTYHLSHTIFYTHHLSLTIFVTHLCQSLSHTHTSLSTTIAWQAWHLATCAFISRGRRGTYGTGLALVARSFTHHIFHSPSLSPIFVNLSHTSLSTTIAPTSLCGVLVFDSVSRALLLQPPASRLRRLITQHNLSSHTLFHTPSLTHNLSHTPITPSFTHHLSHHLSHTIFHTPSFTHNIFHSPSLSPIFVNLSHTSLSTTIAWQASHLATCAFVSRGRRGTYGTGLARGALGLGLVAGDAAALCVAGVALGDIHLRFTWRAWHLVTFARGTYGTGLALVARLGWD